MSIEITNVGKKFGDFVALEGIDLTIPTGQLTALLGPSGGLVGFGLLLLDAGVGGVRLLAQLGRTAAPTVQLRLVQAAYEHRAEDDQQHDGRGQDDPGEGVHVSSFVHLGRTRGARG